MCLSITQPRSDGPEELWATPANPITAGSHKGPIILSLPFELTKGSGSFLWLSGLLSFFALPGSKLGINETIPLWLSAPRVPEYSYASLNLLNPGCDGWYVVAEEGFPRSKATVWRPLLHVLHSADQGQSGNARNF